MKPKDLRTPFRWVERSVVLRDGILYVPDHYTGYEQYDFPGWRAVFGNSNPVIVEYCSGHGHWIVEQAKARPDRNWVAVERQFERVRCIWSKRENSGISNLLIVCGDAFTATHHYFPPASVAGAYINFPDPWPKQRHAKHRLIGPQFLEEVSRVLQPNAQLTLATDDPRSTHLFLDSVDSATNFRPLLPSPYYVTDWPGYGSSMFSNYWRREGRTIHYCSLEKCER